MKEIKKVLPNRFWEEIINYKDIEEIRIRSDKKIILRIKNELIPLNIYAKKDDLSYIFDRITDFSVHTYIENIKQGFITIKGGHRIGLCGEFIEENQKIQNFKEITSLNIRVSKEINIKIDLSKLKNDNVLVISPPNCGKTTLLREISRYLSKEKQNISIIDERFEIDNGLDIGDNVDVLRGVTKKTGVFMMLKTMSPNYIICDEITDNIKLLEEISNAGVKLIATFHAENIEDVPKSVTKYFQKCITISMKNGTRYYKITEV